MFCRTARKRAVIMLSAKQVMEKTVLASGEGPWDILPSCIVLEGTAPRTRLKILRIIFITLFL